MADDLPISFTDSQMSAITNATRPLLPVQRSALLSALAVLFYGRSEVGDGELSRALRSLQREQLFGTLEP